MKRQIFGLLACFVFLVGCEAEGWNGGEGFLTKQSAIIHGSLVKDLEHLETVAIVLTYGGSEYAMCTGTLITPNTVLTAAHCITGEMEGGTRLEVVRPYMRIAIGSRETNFSAYYDIQSFLPHPSYIGTKTLIANDIAILRLKTPIPINDVTPVPPLSPLFDLTPSEVDGAEGILGTTVGFGQTTRSSGSSGVKYETTRKIYAYCPNEGRQSANCRGEFSQGGLMYFNYANGSGVCSGDSGGPTFVSRGGRNFVAGVTSYGYENCTGLEAMTLVSDYYEDFIVPNVENLGIDIRYEDCGNGEDDNNDGLSDCDDPQCVNYINCRNEICNNGVDDNGNGLIDCDDSQCDGSLYCQLEVCDNGVDDNGDGLVDCNDPQCFFQWMCRPDVCHNGIDDNGDGLIDCNDPQCESSQWCVPEICNNGVDDNGDGLIDCNDPQCETFSACIPEICNNGVDDNGNGLIDCEDPQCNFMPVCAKEICFDKIDNNGNGLVDCEDPQCFSDKACIQAECFDDGENSASDGTSGGCQAAVSSKNVQGRICVMLSILAVFLRLGIRRKSYHW